MPDTLFIHCWHDQAAVQAAAILLGESVIALHHRIDLLRQHIFPILRGFLVGLDHVTQDAGHLAPPLCDIGCESQLLVQHFLSGLCFFHVHGGPVIVGCRVNAAPRAIALAGGARTFTFFFTGLTFITGLVWLVVFALVTFDQVHVDFIRCHTGVFGVHHTIFWHGVRGMLDGHLGQVAPADAPDFFIGPCLGQTHAGDQQVDHVIARVVPDAGVLVTKAEVMLEHHVQQLMDHDK